MTDSEVMQELQKAWEYTYLHDSWVTPLAEVLAGVDMQAALHRPSEDRRTTWEIVLHMAKWNENIVERVEGVSISPTDEDHHWPEMPTNPTPEKWEEAKQRLDRSIERVAEMLWTVSLDKIQASEYGLADLLCRFVHMGYHLGQIQ